MTNYIAGILFRATNEARLATTQHRETERIKAWGVDDTSVVPEEAFFVDNRNVKPAVVGTESRRPHHGANFSFSKIDQQGRGCRYASRLETLGSLDIIAAAHDGPLVECIQQAIHFQIGQRELIAQSSGKQSAPITNSREATDESHTDRTECVEIERCALRCSDELW